MRDRVADRRPKKTSAFYIVAARNSGITLSGPCTDTLRYKLCHRHLIPALGQDTQLNRARRLTLPGAGFNLGQAKQHRLTPERSGWTKRVSTRANKTGHFVAITGHLLTRHTNPDDVAKHTHTHTH